jgi:predicted transposase/invertase (TIGR01784 family)
MAKKTKRLNPLNDYLFMKYMGEEGDEEQLIAFLNAVLQRTGRNGIVSVTILERMISAETINNKSSVLDILAKMNDNTIVNIEVQLRDVGNMARRSLYYWCREYTKGIKRGEEYEILPNVITINIVGMEFFIVDKFHTSFHLWEDEAKKYYLTEALEMHFIDMIKFRRLKKKDIVNNTLHRWLTFFDNKTSNETIKKIINMDTAIKKAYEKIQVVTQDETMLSEYEMREKAFYDYNSGINAALKRGKLEGKQEGIAIVEEKVTINLKRLGYSTAEIATMVGKTTEEINKILTEQGLNKK